MATLRELIGGVNTDDGTANLRAEQSIANGMGDLRRGWATGRLGTEINPLRTDELDAQIAGDTAKSGALRAQIAALEQRQGMYTPRVGQVEKIGGVGDALDWAQGQVGQGAASMLDPMAVSAGLGTVGRIAGALPGPGKLIGKAAQLAALGVPALMSKQQLTGEFIGSAGQDEELMARTSPQALRDMAGNYGTLAAIPDSVVPGMIGRQLSGLSRAGGTVARQSTMGIGTKTALGMGMEGATEAGQNMGSQYALGQLNPDRDTSGDFMENVNSFAGGAIGAGPMTAAGAFAEAGHNRVGAGVDRVTEAAGGVVDMLNESKTVQGMKDAVTGAAGKAKDGVIDLASDENGKASIDALVGNLKAGGQELKSQAQSMVDEHRILNDMPPDDIVADDAKAVAWMDQNAPVRHQLVVDKLDAMPEDDAEAQQHLTALTAEYETNGEQQAAIDSAAQFVLERSPAGRVQGRADALGDSLGRIAGVVAPAIGKGIVATGKAALGFGKSVLSGAQDGLRKKNAQGFSIEDEAGADARLAASKQGAADAASFPAWRDNYYGLTGQAAASDAIAEADPAVWSRAELAGSYASDVAARVNPKQPNLAKLARHAAFIMSDMVMRVGAKGLGAQNVRMNRLVDDLHGTFKTEAPEVLQQLGSIMGPKAAPVVEYMTKELTLRSAPGGRAQSMNARDVLARQAVGMVDPESQNRLMKQGVNLNTPRGREQLLNLMEDYADGIGSEPGMRKTLDGTFGKESVDSMMMLLNGQDEQKSPYGVSNQFDSQDAQDGEKSVTKGSGPKVYGFSKAANLRTSGERRDVFGAMAKAESGEAVQRPQLFVKGQRLSPEYLAKLTEGMTINERAAWMKDPENTSAVAKKVADVRKQLMDDPEYPDHDSHRVVEKSAYEVIQESNMQPTKILQLHRDYLTMDGNAEEAAKVASLLAKLVRTQKGTDGQKAGMADPAARKARSEKAAAWSAANPGKSVEDYKAELTAEKMTALEAPLAEAAAAAKDYFSAHSVVVGEQLSNQDSGRITLPDILNLHKEGAGLIERARKADAETGEQTQQALSDANVLMFKDAKDPKKTFAIPAGKLVNWVKQARGKTEAADAEDTKGSFSGKAKDEAYLADVMEGIATLIGSGYVSGMPYKVNQFGKPESFNGGVPGSLRLATKTAGALQKGTETRREKRGRIDNAAFQGADQEAVAADQNRNDEFFTPDDRAQRDLVEDDKRTKPRREQSEQRASDKGGELVTRKGNTDEFGDPSDEGRGTSTKIRVDVSGQVGTLPKYGARDGKIDRGGAVDKFGNVSSGDDRTELDFSSKPKDGVPDEYANQRWLSVQTGASAAGSVGPESKGTAASSAEFRAQAITDAFINEPAKGQEMIRTRIRSALAPEYNANQPEKGKFTVPGVAGRDQLSGGVHYIAPVAYFASAENISKNNLDLPAATISAVQGKVANILLKGEVSPTEKVKIARLMFKGTDTKVTSMNVNAVLGRLAAGPVAPAKALVAKQEAAAPAPKGDIMTKAIAKRQDYLDNPPADYTSEQAVAVASWAKTQLERVMAEKSDDPDRQDQLSDYKYALVRLQKKAASVLEGDESLTDFEGTSAPEVAKAGLPKGQPTQSGALNAQDGNAKVASQADMDAAVAYALKTLGPKIKVDFKDITGYSGEFIDAKNVIEISTTAAAGTLNTLYHEAMHVFFRDFVKGNPKLQATFETLINSPKHLAKLNALLAGYPAAQAQLTSGEERLAYTYQFWKAGLLEVDAKSETWLQKIGKFFRHAMGMVRDSERALELFQAFDNGKMSEPSAAGLVIAKAMDRGTNVLKARRKMDAMMQGLAALTFPSAEILGNSVSPTARRLGTMFFTNPGEESHGTKQPGLMNVRRSVGQQYVNTVNRKFETMSGADQAAVQKYLQAEAELADIPYAEHRAAVKDIRAVLGRFHKYMTDAGMKIGKIDKYYPTVWSAAALNDKKKEFVDMLVNKYAQQMNPDGGNAQKAAERIWQSLVDKEGVDAHLPTDRDDGVLSPFFASQEMRTLPWLEGADKEMFLEKNMPLTLTRYFNQGAHATEYFRRFGKGGTKLDDMINGTKMWNPQTQSHDRMPNGIIHEIRAASRAMLKRGEFKDPKAQGKWVARQMRDITQATGAMEGSLGKDVSPNMRKFNSWMAVYQNIRLLPMALFSSFVDPLSMVARGAPWQAAYDTFVYSMREVFRGWADAFRDMPPEREKDEWRKLAEAIGASEIAMFSHHVSDEYSSTYMSAGAKKINDKMFVFNGMEAWNRGNRIMATKWAVRFIEQHAGLPDKHHSARWLKELGLTPDMVTKDAEGNLITNRHELAEVKGISLEQATKEMGPIHLALNRWVEGAVLTPNAAQRPSWSSDPNYASMFHLKQFSYSFHQTILKRATNEFKHGNMAPLGALAMFIPTMIGADIMKGLIQGAGTLPPYMAGMNAGDWLVHGAQRAGLAGIGSIGMDTGTDWASLGGPAFEQIVDAGRDGFGSKSVMNAMPVHALYAHLVA